MLPGIIQDLVHDLRQNGVSVENGIPTGITRNKDGEAILYFKGTELEPRYLMEVDTLIGSPLTWDEIRDSFVGLNEDVEYYHGFDWDTTEAGFVDIRRPNGTLFRYYFTMHQPTNEINWYRKIKAELKGGGFQSIWEKFDKENYDGFIKDDVEIINVKGELG